MPVRQGAQGGGPGPIIELSRPQDARHISSVGHQPRVLVQPLSSLGDGSGVNNLIGDYSAVPAVFSIKPGSKEVFRISQIIGYIEGAGAFGAGGYGAGAALANGIEVEYDFEGTAVKLTDGHPVLTNGHWALQAHDLNYQDFGTGQDPKFISFKWTLTETGVFVRLDGNLGEELRMTLRDSFVGLTQHKFMAFGYKE